MSSINLTPIGQPTNAANNTDNKILGINATFTSITLNSLNQPYVAFCESGQVKVKRCIHIDQLTAPSTVWQDHSFTTSPGVEISSTQFCSHTCLVFKNGTVYLAFIDKGTINVYEDTADGWQKIVSPTSISDASFLEFRIDNSATNNSIYLAYINSNKEIHVHIYHTLSKSWVPKITPHVSFKRDPGSPPEIAIANNLSISGFNGHMYLVFSDFSTDNIGLVDSGTDLRPLKHGRTTILQGNTKGSITGDTAELWSTYGFYGETRNPKGMASSENSLGFGPTYLNHVNAIGFNNVYFAYRGGFASYGGANLGVFYSKNPFVVPANPNWADFFSDTTSDHVMGTKSEIKEALKIPGTDHAQQSGNYITSALDTSGNIYFFYSTDFPAAITVFKFTAELPKGTVSIPILSDTKLFPGKEGGAYRHYLSLAIDSVKNHKYIAFVDFNGFVNVARIEGPEV